VRTSRLTVINLNSTIFWDITPYSPLKVNQSFRGISCFLLRGRRMSRARNHSESRCEAERCTTLLGEHLFLSFFLGLIFGPEDGGHMFFPKRLTFNGLHGVISQKIILFLTTAVRISNPTIINWFIRLKCISKT
jgi:hypothetical protein